MLWCLSLIVPVCGVVVFVADLSVCDVVFVTDLPVCGVVVFVTDLAV